MRRRSSRTFLGVEGAKFLDVGTRCGTRCVAFHDTVRNGGQSDEARAIGVGGVDLAREGSAKRHQRKAVCQMLMLLLALRTQ